MEDAGAHKIRSLSEFVDCVREMRQSWSVADHEELWFRGENRDYEHLRLRPALYRPNERQQLKPTDDLLDIEYRLHKDFQANAPVFMTDPVDYEFWEWDSYLLFQHHGGATRLLDWSDGAMIALQFAVGDPRDDISSGDAIVYVVSWSRLKEKIDCSTDGSGLPARWRDYVGDLKSKGATDFKEEEFEDAYLPGDKDDRRQFAIPSVPIILEFPRFTRRVAAQRSQLVLFGSDPEFFDREYCETDSTIGSIQIDAAHRRQIRRELRDAGVTESVIFPDLDGLGRELKLRWLDQK